MPFAKLTQTQPTYDFLEEGRIDHILLNAQDVICDSQCFPPVDLVHLRLSEGFSH